VNFQKKKKPYFCVYHWRFGRDARKCQPLCDWNSGNEQTTPRWRPLGTRHHPCWPLKIENQGSLSLLTPEHKFPFFQHIGLIKQHAITLSYKQPTDPQCSTYGTIESKISLGGKKFTVTLHIANHSKTHTRRRFPFVASAAGGQTTEPDPCHSGIGEIILKREKKKIKKKKKRVQIGPTIIEIMEYTYKKSSLSLRK